MKQIILTVCATLIALLGHGQNAGQEFTMQQSEYVVIDNTPYGFARHGSNSREADISVSVGLKPVSDRDMRWRCKYGAELDTLILAVQRNDFYEGGWIDIKKFPNGIAISEYLADNYAKANSKSNDKIAYYTEKVLAHLESEPWIDREKQKAEELAALEREQRYRLIGNIEYDFTEPTGSIQTKSGTNPFGAKGSYQYYVNENGYEVKHGKMTTVMAFNDHKYWVGGNHGFIHITGTETLTETYRNGILHGPLTYRCNANADSTFGNPEDINRSYNLNIYKGFLTGNFKFSYNGITYTGKAINGILEYCDYQTNDGFHGRITSNPNSKSISVAEINNGYNTFEFDDNIKLPSIITVMPTFRFPLMGN